ncbi:GNAT family N-acetyltransferase [Phytopseudomonas punonensis]|uniref:Ribosomal-protein-alanine N-acetyltransferase n=1 Tax=Phytopseudomonas punonensis TaxID=1220495 RepID=A0A1M7J6N0_9GAMM|nr:GNAT family protein [Pseudomonas punonensis]SHM48779.1 ribosomal-protein-alanine N-acetyltransferase [Pseudomonas punonensis]
MIVPAWRFGLYMHSEASLFPEFTLADCILRCIRPDDIERVYAGLSHPQVIAHYGVSYDSLCATREQMQWYESLLRDRRGIWWAVASRDGDLLMGACGFNDWSHQHHSVDVGYWLLPDYWRRGLLSQALPAILRYAFRHMSVHRVHADIEPENIASCRLIEAQGFTLEGTLRDVECKDGRYLSLHQYSLLATDAAAHVLLD